MQRLAERPALGALLLLLIAVALLSPRLSAAGLWDPHEVRLLESAADPITLSSLWQNTSSRPRLLLWPMGLGIRLFGLNELGGRSPMIVLGLLTLLAIYALGRFLATAPSSSAAEGRRTALGPLFSGLVLLSSPLFFLSSRHASLTLLPMLGQTLSVLGLAMLGWPRARRRTLDVVLGMLLAGVGLLVGLFTTGAIVGVAAPLLTAALALALADGPWLPQLLYGGLCGAALLPPLRLVLAAAALPSFFRFAIAGGCLLSAALTVLSLRGRSSVKMLSLSTLLTAIAIGLLPGIATGRPSGFSPYFAGILHWPTLREPQIDSLLRGIGFYFFPWIGLLPLAIVSSFTKLYPQAADSGESGDDAAARTSFSSLLPLTWFVVTYCLTTLHCALVGDLGFPAFPALALLVGSYLARMLDEPELGGVAAGLCGGLCVIMVGHDFFFAPEQYLSGHLTETLHWPAPLAPVGEGLTLLAVVLGLMFGLGLGAGIKWRRRLLGLSCGLTLLLAALAVHGLAPALSQHLSYRGLYTRYQKLGGGALALYGVQQSSGKIYGHNSVQLYSLPDVLHFLADKPEQRSFVIVGAAELGAVDREARLRGQRYFVVDNSNAQFLLLCNRLLPGETDLNPLLRSVSDIAPHPQVPLQVNFDDKIELVGYDIPSEVSRGDELVVRLYFKVLTSMPASYHVFLHFDGMGTRWNGDHIPLDGKFPTNLWSPGTYVTDEHRITVSRMSQPAGYYQIFTGFWPGGDGARLRVTAGSHESDMRVHIGVLRVK